MVGRFEQCDDRHRLPEQKLGDIHARRTTRHPNHGNNPATITGPQQDLNLGIQVSVDGGATITPDQISIDTSQVATDTIQYAATDQYGLIGYATRTVIVQAAASTP